jgi:CHAT domain-containing protein
MKSLFCLLFGITSTILWGQKELKKAQEYFNTQKYPECIEFSLKALEKSPISSKDYWLASNLLSESYYNQYQIEELETFSIKNLELYTKTFGMNDTSNVQAYSNLATVSYFFAEYQNGIDYSLQIQRILQANDLKNTTQYASNQNNLGFFYSEIADYNKAKLYLDSSLVFYSTDESLYAHEIASIEINLGNFYQYLNDYGSAISSYKHFVSLDSSGKISDPTTRFNGYLGYSTLLAELSDFDQSLKLAKIAEEIGKTENDEPMLSSAYNNLGVIYKNLGDYRNAEFYLNTSYQIDLRTLEPDHPSLISTKNNFANFYNEIGNYEKAELMHKEILEIVEKDQQGTFKNKKSTYYNNFALISQMEDKHKEAIKYFTKALECETVNFEKNKIPLYLINNLCGTYLDNKNITEAEKIYKEYNIDSRIMTENSEDVAYALSKKAEIFLLKNDLENALSYIIQAENYFLKYYNDKSVELFEIQMKKGFILKKLGDYNQSAKVLSVVCENYISFLEKNLLTLTEGEKTLYSAKVRPCLNLYYQVITELNPTDISYNEQFFNFRLRTKSISLRYGKKVFDEVLKSDNQALKDLSLQLMTERKAYNKYLSMSKHDLKNIGVNLEILEKNMQIIEKDFYMKASKFLSTPENKDFKALQKELSDKEALVEIIRIEEPYAYDENAAPYQYVALIVRKDRSYPILVKISSNNLETKYMYFYLNSVANLKKDILSYQKFWIEIDKQLNGIEKIEYSPDGCYHKLNINSLYDDKTGKFLLEKYQISQYLSLLALENASLGDIKNMALFGNPTYYLDLKPIFDSMEKNETPTTRTVSVGFESWSKLPGTKKEIELIAKIGQGQNINIQSFSEEKALENNFKNLKNQQIIHIATHGFYDASSDTNELYSEKSFINPMLKNGLVFAGGGASSDGANFTSQSMFFEDGLLNAQEVSVMDFSGTELVVLSACNSGQGEIRNEEGVFGLQRGFAIAGAKYVLASLWAVDDTGTQEFMVEYYKNLFQTKNYEIAYTQTMKTIITKYPNIYYWGAFNLIKL